MSEDLELEIARLKEANAELISRGADYLQRIEELEAQHKKDVALMDIRQANEYDSEMKYFLLFEEVQNFCDAMEKLKGKHE